MKRYENWLVAAIFLALLVLFLLVLDVRSDVASLRRDAAYNAASGRRDLLESSASNLDERLRCLEGNARALEGMSKTKC